MIRVDVSIELIKEVFRTGKVVPSFQVLSGIPVDVVLFRIMPCNYGCQAVSFFFIEPNENVDIDSEEEAEAAMCAAREVELKTELVREPCLR